MAISVTDFTLAAPSGLTVKTATLAALDTSGAVTAGAITESATPPLVGDGSWLAWNGADGTRPAGLQSVTLTAGTHTLYGHAKDGAGNRGSSAGQGVTVSAGGATPQSFLLGSVNTAQAYENTPTAYNGSNGTTTLGIAQIGGYDTGKGWGYYHFGAIWAALTVAGGSISSLKIKMRVTVNPTGGASKQPMPLNIRAITAGLSAFATSPAGSKPTGVPKTTDAVEWTIPASVVSGDWVTTPELVSLLSESGWTSGTALGFVIELSDTAGTGAGTPLGTFLTTAGAWYLALANYASADRAVLLVNGAA